MLSKNLTLVLLVLLILALFICNVSFSTAGGTLALTFDGVLMPGPGQDATTFIDQVSLTSAVPEPGTWALMLGGLAGMAAQRRRWLRD